MNAVLGNCDKQAIRSLWDLLRYAIYALLPDRSGWIYVGHDITISWTPAIL
jgi:hypothetical protein